MPIASMISDNDVEQWTRHMEVTGSNPDMGANTFWGDLWQVTLLYTATVHPAVKWVPGTRDAMEIV